MVPLADGHAWPRSSVMTCLQYNLTMPHRKRSMAEALQGSQFRGKPSKAVCELFPCWMSVRSSVGEHWMVACSSKRVVNGS